MQLILASTSKYRAALLERFGRPFTALAPEVDETRLAGERPEALVGRLAEAKAEAIADRVEGPALIVGSDQVAVLDADVLGKPGTELRAVEQLRRLSGREVRFFTGVCVLEVSSGAREVRVVETPVEFRRLEDAEIADYVRRERPLDCAGAFKSEGLGIALFERIGGDDPTALIGLPLIALRAMLARRGYRVLG